MLYRWEQDGVVIYRSPVLEALDVPHGFGTRLGGHDEIAAALGLADRAWVVVRQVHGHAIHLEDHRPADDRANARCEADAVVLTRPDAATRVVTADCVPVLLASVDGQAVAAVHAGWRGLVSGVLAEAVDVLARPFVAAIGPCIGVARFEVGREVAERFDPRFVRRDPGCKPHVDLRAAAHQVLHDLGARSIDTTDRCTVEHADEFFSHRRDVTHGGAESTGRMASVIACRAEAVSHPNK